MSETKKRFSRRLKTEEVEIETEKGTVEVWTLRELTGALRNDYLNEQSKKINTANGVEVKDFTGLCSDLLTKCLFNPAGVNVSAAEVDNWPSEMQMEIYQMAIKLSALDKKAEDAEKKPSSAKS